MLESAAKDVTPYIHLLVHHVPTMLARHGTLGIFSCEYLERVNKKQRRFILHHSNHLGVCDTRLAMIRSHTLPVSRTGRAWIRRAKPDVDLPLHQADQADQA